MQKQCESPTMQLKFTVEKGSKPNLHDDRGRFIWSLSKTMGLQETADELVTGYIPDYKDKTTGEIRFLSPTAHSKIAATVACKLMGEKVAITGCHEKSIDKDEFMAQMIEEAQLAKYCGRKACTSSRKLHLHTH